MNVLTTAVLINEEPFPTGIPADEEIANLLINEYVDEYYKAVESLESLPSWTPLVRITNGKVIVTTVGEYFAPPKHDWVTDDDTPF